jgi:DNA-binding XRE family transcriptional regulator
MNKQQFEIWLITNGYTQASLAKRLDVSSRTVWVWKNQSRFPVMFLLALQALTLTEGKSE